MSTIEIALNGKPTFHWEGDTTEVANIMTDFPKGARGVNLTPEALADNCIRHYFRTGAPLTEDAVGREMQMMGVLWRILNSATGSPEHPGKFADYAGSLDLVVNLSEDEHGVSAEVVARGRFDA